MAKIIYFDPVTKEWLPNLNNYEISPYNRNSFLVNKVGEDEANVVDLADNNGMGSCTCQDFLFRKDPNNTNKRQEIRHNSDRTCKHIRMIKYLIRKISRSKTASAKPTAKQEKQ